MSIDLQIDKSKCVKCGLCTKDCSLGCLMMGTDGYPTVNIDNENNCLRDQHCLAICPTGALSILGKDPKDSDITMRNWKPDDILNLIKSRRSIREYKDENVDPITMKRLKEMLSWVPSGCNNHGIEYTFIDDKEVMKEFRNYTNSKLIKLLKRIPIGGTMGVFKKAILNGCDVIFQGAPHMLVVSVPNDAPCKTIDPTIAASYFELYAQSLGLGTLWCGFAEICIRLFPELNKKLEISKGYKATRVILFGPTPLRYARATQPDASIIKIVKKGEFKKLSVLEKIKQLFTMEMGL
ncbi:MAG: nitroreductase family protein [Candidatus Gastranaerophilales bacterium]|nr:nitroreductase family protein [Candidatus Gastranaerophilales bacterium]